MNRQQYREYLRSPHWQQLRQRILGRAAGRCEWCHRFCGRNPHSGTPYCGFVLECDWCAFYFDGDGERNDCEVQSLHVHHLTYERLGYERDEDLAGICESCHDEVTERAQLVRGLYRAGLISRGLSTVRSAGVMFWEAIRQALRNHRGGR